MDKNEILNIIERLVDAAKTAVLATVDAENWPHIRWMTPVRLRGRPEALYAISSTQLAKTAQLARNPCVEWMFQDQTLREVVIVRGRVNLIDNPALKSEVLEAVGLRLAAFWKANQQGTGLVVLETVIDEAIYYLPLEGRRTRVRFGDEAEGA